MVDPILILHLASKCETIPKFNMLPLTYDVFVEKYVKIMVNFTIVSEFN